MTKVINCRDRAAVLAAQRAGNYVYIGRGRDLGPWGNKYSHLPSDVPGVVHVHDRKEAIRRHREDTHNSPELIRKIKRELKDKVLGCWCHPLPCHGQTLAQIANEEEEHLLAERKR